VRAVFARLDALEPPVVTDPEQRSTQAVPPRRTLGGPAIPDTLAVIGFELPPEMPWPLPGSLNLAEGVGGEPVLLQRIDGSAAERQKVLAALEQARPWSLLVVCHAASSPDRGTARFLREVAPLARQCHLLLALEAGGAAPGSAESRRRWADWLSSEQLDAIKLVPEPSEPDRPNA